MDATVIALRIVHVATGVFWAGAIMFIVAFLEPSLRGAGPAGAPVMQQLMQRKLFNIMPLIAILTLASGFWLYFRAGAVYGDDWMRTRAAMTLGTGGIIATVAFIVGVLVLRPGQLRAFDLAGRAQQAQPAERDTLMAEAAALRNRNKVTGRVIAALLLLATLTMAVARYV